MRQKDVVYNLSKNDIAKILRQMADSVESEDSMDGYMEYHWEENGTFSCLARYRVGNLNGQGSWLHLKDENLE